MKKLLISLVAMVAFSGMVFAQNAADIKADAQDAAKGVEAGDVEAAAAGASSGALGLRVGLGFGYVSDFLNKGEDLQTLGVMAGGGGFVANTKNTVGSLYGSVVNASAEGSALGITGLAFDLNVEYDILPFLFARTGFGYTQGLGTEHTFKLVSGSTTQTAAFTTASNHMEIPLLIGINFINTGKSAVYGAAGVEYSMGDFKYTISATTTGLTIKDVESELKASGLAIAYVMGGRTEVASKINLFFEWKNLISANSAEYASRTKNDGSSFYADNAAVSLAGTLIGAGAPGITPMASTDTEKGSYGLNMSYQKFVLGVSYSL